MAFNPNIFKEIQFLYSPQTTGMQIGNMQGMFSPGVLLANRNNPSRGSAFDGSTNRLEEQLNLLNDTLGSKGSIDTSGKTRRQKKKPKEIADVIEDIKDKFGGDGTKSEKDDGTYGGLTFQQIKDLQEIGFDQQNKLFQQNLAMGGIDKVAQGYQVGPQAFLESVLPQIFAGNAAILSAGAANTRSLANVYSQPITPIPRMGYYS